MVRLLAKASCWKVPLLRAKPVAIAEATSQDEPQEDAVQTVDSVEAELAEKQAANEAEATAEVAEEPVIETAEEDASAVC